MDTVSHYIRALNARPLARPIGRVSRVAGLVVESVGPRVLLGELCEIHSAATGGIVRAEVVGLHDEHVVLMPLAEVGGVAIGDQVTGTGAAQMLGVGEALLGRVIDPFGTPLDSLPAPTGLEPWSLKGRPINPLARQPIAEVLQTGVRAIDGLLTIGRGQRMGIFAGSGVGKSTLLGMLARNVDADLNVIAMIGERGREVREFVEHTLGAEGLARSVVVVATSDQSALARLHAAYAALTVAEFFRAQARHVMLIMDSLTRFAMAQREVGLAAGEPPTARGYTPSVFSLLPRLLERCGTNADGGSVTALATILVEGDDLNDPVADSIRSIIDGHIVLDRDLANSGHYPAIDVLRSVSRLMPALASAQERALIERTVRVLSLLRRHQDVVDLGAYQAGSNPELDSALAVWPALERWLRQPVGTLSARAEALQQLATVMAPTTPTDLSVS
jgi:flagellum-specific ATP synthase